MIRNCTGQTTTDIKKALLQNLDQLALSFLLDQECAGGSSGGIALANFDAFNIFAAKQSLNYINNADANNKSLPGGGASGFVLSILPSLIESFANNECTGQNNVYKNLARQYNPNPYKNMYPSTLSDSQKNKLTQILSDTNFNAAARNQMSPSAANNTLNPYLVVNDIGVADSIMLKDASGDVFSDNTILSQISLDTVQNLNTSDKIIYSRCFSRVFDIANYLVPYSDRSPPVVTDIKITNIKKIHDTILLPIYDFYYGTLSDSLCNMRIVGGISSVTTSVAVLSGSVASKHITGEAVNFMLTTIPMEKVIADLKSKLLFIDFGIVYMQNGILITSPFIQDGYVVDNMILETPKNDSDYIITTFI